MTISAAASILGVGESAPLLADTCFVAAGARIVGAVTLGAHASVWYNAVLRGDRGSIRVGARSNLQDGVVVHVDAAAAAEIGEDVSIGHNAVVHGCTIGDGCLIGMNSTVLSGAVIGDGSLVAAGSVVREGAVIPPGSLVAGVPATVRRGLTAEESDGLLQNARTYLALAGVHGAAAEE